MYCGNHRVDYEKPMSTSSRSIVVIGLGSFGASVARELSRFGDRVLGIDSSEARVAHLSDVLYRSVIADARDERALEEAGVKDYDIVVVAIASDLECSVLSCMNARQLEVPQIWAKASSRTHARILGSIGVDRILQPEQEFGEHIAHMLHNAAMLEFVRLAPSVHLASVRTGSRHVGQLISELKLLDKFGLRCLGLVRDGAFVTCADAAALLDDDALIVIGTRQNMRDFADRL